MESDNHDFECRVCRGEGEDVRPLYTPCLCSGSIGLVHQDCLEAWLAHSKKDTCELCNSKYYFVAEYAENSPASLPLTVLIKSTFKIVMNTVLPFAIRWNMCIGVWLICVPIVTAYIYCFSIGRASAIFDPASRSFSFLQATIVQGIIIDGLIALTLLILMAFTDFLRFHWVNADGPAAADIHNEIAAAAPPNVAAAAEAAVEADGHQDAFLGGAANYHRRNARRVPAASAAEIEPEAPTESKDRPRVRGGIATSSLKAHHSTAAAAAGGGGGGGGVISSSSRSRGVIRHRERLAPRSISNGHRRIPLRGVQSICSKRRATETKKSDDGSFQSLDSIPHNDVAAASTAAAFSAPSAMGQGDSCDGGDSSSSLSFAEFCPFQSQQMFYPRTMQAAVPSYDSSEVSMSVPMGDKDDGKAKVISSSSSNDNLRDSLEYAVASPPQSKPMNDDSAFRSSSTVFAADAKIVDTSDLEAVALLLRGRAAAAAAAAAMSVASSAGNEPPRSAVEVQDKYARIREIINIASHSYDAVQQKKQQQQQLNHSEIPSVQQDGVDKITPNDYEQQVLWHGVGESGAAARAAREEEEALAEADNAANDGEFCLRDFEDDYSDIDEEDIDEGYIDVEYPFDDAVKQRPPPLDAAVANMRLYDDDDARMGAAVAAAVAAAPEHVHNNNNNNAEDDDNNQNNNQNNNAEDDDNNQNNNQNNNNAEDVHDVGVEIRIALREVMGLGDEPLYVMVRNAAWLLVFCAIYLGVMVSIPFTIGGMAAKKIFIVKGTDCLGRIYNDGIISWIYLQVRNVGSFILPTKLIEMAVILKADASAFNSHKALQFHDLSIIALGYVSMFTVMYLTNLVAISSEIIVRTARRWLSRALSGAVSVNRIVFSIHGYIEQVVASINKVTMLVKVAVLLILRIFGLPLFLGVILLLTIIDKLLQTSAATWCDFLISNPVGAYSLAWVAGISFMLLMTLSVLQIREVMHPDWLALVIRPQEQHADLIKSLVSESGFIHARRIVVSVTVYLILMFLLLWLPITVVFSIFPNTPLISVRTWYGLPELQLPLELLVGHIFFLSFLDGHKDIIGRAQYWWLYSFSAHLGVTRALLPCITAPSPVMARAVLHDGTDVAPIMEVEGEAFTVLKRPPPGWDNKSASASSRWAWDQEIPSTLQRSVLPRKLGSSVGDRLWIAAKLFALFVISWVMCSTVTIGAIIVPLNVGRYVLALLQLPAFLSHDPINYIAGAIVTSFCIIVLQELLKTVIANAKLFILQEAAQALLSTTASNNTGGGGSGDDVSLVNHRHSRVDGAAGTAAAAVAVAAVTGRVPASLLYRMLLSSAAAYMSAAKKIMSNLRFSVFWHIVRLVILWLASEFAVGLLISYLVWPPLHIQMYAAEIANIRNSISTASIAKDAASIVAEMFVLFKDDVFCIISFKANEVGVLVALWKAFVPESCTTFSSIFCWIFKVWFRGTFVVEAILYFLLQSNEDPNQVRLPFGGGITIASVYPLFAQWAIHIKAVVLDAINDISNGVLTWPNMDIGEVLPLDAIETFLVKLIYDYTFKPLFTLVLTVLLVLYCTGIYCRVCGISLADSLFEAMCIEAFHVSAILCTLMVFTNWFSPILMVPVESIASAFLNKVRDDNYLVGRKLQNLSEQSASRAKAKPR